MFSHQKSTNFHDLWVGTDTPGPGEAVFAIRFNGKPQILWKKMKFQNPKQKLGKIRKFPIRTLFGEQLEMSSV